MSRPRCRTLRFTLIITFTAFVALAPRAAFADGPASDWNTAAREAVELLRRDDLAGAAALAATLQAAAPDLRTRTEAAAVTALAQLAGGERAVVNDARAALMQLESQLPGLLDRPDCELALGRAAIPLGETNSALFLLTAAADEFAAAGLKQRAATALVGLAAAWARHGEWELTGPPFVAQRPRNETERFALRVARIREIAERLATLDAGVEPRDAVELELLRLAPPADSGGAAISNAESRFAALADAAPRSIASGRAALELAERFLAKDREAEALALLERAAKSVDPTVAEAARALRSAQAEMHVSMRIVVDSQSRTATIEPAWKNADRAVLEVFAVDPKAWLADRAARFNLFAAAEKHGSQIASREWKSASASATTDSFTATAPSGRLMIARLSAFDATGRAKRAHQIVSVDPLRAEVALGPERAAIWAVDPRIGKPPTVARFSFWMAGTYVAAGGALEDGATIFSLPAEARLTNDPRWLALVEADDMSALVFGQRPPDGDADELQAQLVSPGGSPRPGEPIQIHGVLSRAGRVDVTAAAGLRLELRDAAGKSVAAAPCRVRNGLLDGEFTVDPAWAADVLRVTVLQGDRVVSQWGASLTVTPATRRVPLHVTVDAPRLLPPDSDLVTFQLDARYPWGARVPDGTAEEALWVTRLPTKADAELRDIRKISHSRGYSGWGDPRAGFLVAELRGLDGPAAVLLRAAVSDGGLASGFADRVLLTEDKTHAWILPNPPASGEGDASRLNVGWIAPRASTWWPPPTVALTPPDANAEPAQLPLARAGRGWSTSEFHWRTPGTWRAALSVRPGATEPAATADVHVGASASPPSAAWRPRHPVAAVYSLAAASCRVEPPSGAALALLLAPEPVSVRWLEADRPPGAIELSSKTRPTDAIFLSASKADAGEAGVAACPVDTPRIPLETSASIAASGQLQLRIATAGEEIDAPLEAIVQFFDAAADLRAIWNEHRPPATERAIRLATYASKPVLPNLDTPLEGRPIPQTEDLRPRLTPSFESRAPLACHRATLSAGETMLELPMPLSGSPIYYTILVVSRDGRIGQAGGLARGDAGLAVRLDGPASCVLGDRVELTAVIENRSEVAVDVQLQWGEPDGAVGGIGAGRMAFLRALPIGDTPPADASTPIRIAAGRSLTTAALFEAAAPGTARPALRVRQHQGPTYVAESAARVAVPADGSDDAPIVIRRSLSRLLRANPPAAPPSGAPDGATEPDPAQLQTVALGVDEAVESGTLLLVRDEIELARPLRGVRWTQAMPATGMFRPIADQSQLAQSIRIEDGLPGAYNGRSEGLPAGRHVMEYGIQAGRPGAATFAAPSIRAGDQAVPVRVEPAELRLVVTR